LPQADRVTYEGLKSKFTIFIGTKNLFNPKRNKCKVTTNQEVFIWNGIKERRFHPTFSNQPSTKANSFHSKLWINWSSMCHRKYHRKQDNQIKKP